MLLDWTPTQCFLEKKTIEAAPRSPWRFITTSFDASTLSPCRVCHFENSLWTAWCISFLTNLFVHEVRGFVSKYFQDIFSKRYFNARSPNLKERRKKERSFNHFQTSSMRKPHFVDSPQTKTKC